MHHALSLVMSVIYCVVSAGGADNDTNLTLIVGVSAGGLLPLIMTLVIVLVLLHKRRSTMEKGNYNAN